MPCLRAVGLARRQHALLAAGTVDRNPDCRMGVLHGFRGLPHRAQSPSWRIRRRVSSLIDVRPAPGRFPAGAILLIALGFICCSIRPTLSTWSRWSVIACRADSVWPLFALCQTEPRRASSRHRADPNPEPRNERQSAYLCRAVTGPIILITIEYCLHSIASPISLSQTWRAADCDRLLRWPGRLRRPQPRNPERRRIMKGPAVRPRSITGR